MTRLMQTSIVTALLLLCFTCVRAETNPPLREVGHPTFVSPHASPIAISGRLVFVANTPSDTVDVIDAHLRKVKTRVPVGVDPVSVAVRPDGKEVWVSNHVSDSVSVIDADPTSPSYLQIVATIQQFDEETKSTQFDEPVGIAFANNTKAYVALSSENAIAVVNVNSREVERRLAIPAQDPRAIVVRGDRLYVIPFESNNKTQLSGGTGKIDGNLTTFNAWEHSIANNNVLSLGHVVDIVKHPTVPDRDLFVFDTQTDELIQSVDSLGTLLYGLAVDSQGRVFITQTDARNDANGRAGTKKHGLAELENRAFLNRITTVDLKRLDHDSVATKSRIPEIDIIDLEPRPPHLPSPESALGTPFAVQISDDDTTLYVSAAGSDKLFTVDANSGLVIGRTDVGAVPRGIAIRNIDGKSTQAWVLNAVANTVSIVDVSQPNRPQVTDTITLHDPTHPAVKRGRIAFNTAAASTTKTFSCASCHPDGHTDQLLWVLKTPIVTGGDQIMPRSTMPIRGLRDTAPFHWDGIPGDPYGGNNSANVHGTDEPNSDREDPTSTTRHLIDGGIASTMSHVNDRTKNDEGKAGGLSAAARDDMATFLLSVPYPPAQRRAYTNVVSEDAKKGFQLFHIDGDHDPKQPTPNVCGNCHRFPFLVSTNTPGTGMDAPTWRGAYDRFLILPQGRLNIIDFDFYRSIAKRGIPERNMWQFSWGGRHRFDPVWDMVLEGSTGFSGAFARQVTLSPESINDDLTLDLLAALELSASEETIILEVDGVFVENQNAVQLQFDSDAGVYRNKKSYDTTFDQAELLSLVTQGKFIGTFTGRHGAHADVDAPQPAIWTLGPIEQQRGRQDFPILFQGHNRMAISGRHVRDGANVIVDGRRVNGVVHVDASDELVRIELPELPDVGMHILQLQNRNGMFSNDFIFHVTDDADGAKELRRQTDRAHVDLQTELAAAVSRGDTDEVNELLQEGARIDARQPRGGSTPLSNAALHGRSDIAALLLDKGAKVASTNVDGNTPLHVAAFLCRTQIVDLLLEHGASPQSKNNRGETTIDVVSGDWNDELMNFYRSIADRVGIDLDLNRIERDRPRIATRLRTAAER